MIHGHDRRLLAMMEGAQNLTEETPDAQVVVLNWLTRLSKVYNMIQLAKKRKRQGGKGETAHLLVTHPALVNPERNALFHGSPEDLRRIQGSEPIKTGGATFYSTRQYSNY